MTKCKYCQAKANEDDTVCSVCGATDYLEEVKSSTKVYSVVFEEPELDDSFHPVGMVLSIVIIIVTALAGLILVASVGG